MGRRTAACAALAFIVALAVLAFGSRAAQGATGLVASVRSAPTEATDAVTAAAAATEAPMPSTVADETDDGIARVVVVGDSLVAGAEDELTAQFAAHGVEVTYLAVSGTGLLTDQGVRLTELEAALDELHPDVVILESCCNYDGAYTLFDGTVVPADSDLLWTTWSAQAERMVQVAEDHGADVRAVITPRLVGDTASATIAYRIQRFNEVYRDLGVGLIDWDAALYPDGSTTGRSDLRLADGLHLSDAGDDLVAAATWAAVAGSFS